MKRKIAGMLFIFILVFFWQARKDSFAEAVHPQDVFEGKTEGRGFPLFANLKEGPMDAGDPDILPPTETFVPGTEVPSATPRVTIRPTATPMPTPTIKPEATPTATVSVTPKPDAGNNNLDDLDNMSCSVKYTMVSLGGKQKAAAKITWTLKNEAYKYQIYRADENHYAKYKLLAVCDVVHTSFIDKTVKKGGTYYYKVRALGGTVTNSYTGSFSNEKMVYISETLLKPVIDCKRSGNKLIIYFKKAEGDNYLLQYCFRGSKKWKSGARGKVKSKVSNKFSAKKTLQIRIRTEMKVQGKKVYSKWSAYKTIKI